MVTRKNCGFGSALGRRRSQKALLRLSFLCSSSAEAVAATLQRRMSATWSQLAKRHRHRGTNLTEITRVALGPQVRVLGDRMVVAMVGLGTSRGLVGKEKKVAEKKVAVVIPRLPGVTTTKRNRRATKIGKATGEGFRTTPVGVATMHKATGRKTRAIGVQMTQQPIPRGETRIMRVGMISGRVKASKDGMMGHPEPEVRAGRETRGLVGVVRNLIIMEHGQIGKEMLLVNGTKMARMLKQVVTGIGMEIGGEILGHTIGLLVKVPGPIRLASVGRVAGIS